MSGMTMVSTDSAADVTKALGMYKAKSEGETQNNSAQVTEAQAAPAASEKITDAPEATEVVTDSVDQASTDDVDTTQNAEAQEADKNAGKDKKGGFQRRIDKLTKARTLAEQERDLLREENLRLKQSQNQTQAGAQDQQVSAQDATDPEPDPEKFANVRDYLKAQTRWEIKQEQKKTELAKKTTEAKTVFQSKIQDFHKKVGDFKKTTADFDEVAAEFDETYPSGMPHAMLDLIADAENGPQIMYDLAKDHSEFERIANLPPLALAREIGKREAKIAVNSGGTQTPKNKTTSAPAPMAPVRGSAAVNTKDPGEMSMREYNAWRDSGGGR